MPLRFRAVSFDLFDTLVDLEMDGLPRVEIAGRLRPSTVGALHAALPAETAIALDDLAAAVRAVDRGSRERVYREGRELPTLERFREVARHLGIDDPELPLRLTEVHMGVLHSLASTPDHHADLLGALQDRLRVGLCSNFSHAPTARRILEESRLAAGLDVVVISEEHGLRKPRREIFEALLDALDTEPADTLHVGDNLQADVAGAAALGMGTVWITRRVPDPAAALRAAKGPAPDWIVSDLAELAGILDGSVPAGATRPA